MKVLLVDVDSKIPNLALMQISAWHKAEGDWTGLDVADPDMVYISCVFKKNAAQARGIATMFPNARVSIGGSGISWDRLPDPMVRVKPDYDLYPSEYSQGFTTRGCIRACPFCIVRRKEGEYKRWQHISEFHDQRFGIVRIMDNNWYADKEWFFENTRYIIERDLKVIEGGMDIRLLDHDIAERLKDIRWAKPMKFAWDNMNDEPAVIKGIETLEDAGINIRHNVHFYVLVGYNTTHEQDVYRCQKLKELGTNAFVMPFKKTPEINALARWANRKWAFWATDFKNYKRGSK